MTISCINSTVETEPETWLWIGPREAIQWTEAYRFVESSAGQIAHRDTIDDALSRPCAPANRIVLAKPDSSIPATEKLQALLAAHPAAEFSQITGVCCAADPAAVRLDPGGILPWHQAVNRWTETAHHANAERMDPPGTSVQPKSVGIVAAQLIDAEILLDVAASCGVTAIWFRSMNEVCARNVEAFWWDDSVLTHRRIREWSHAFSLVANVGRADAKHTWLVGLPNPQDVQHAISAGMDQVISKPIHVPALLNSLAGGPQNATVRVRTAA